MEKILYNPVLRTKDEFFKKDSSDCQYFTVNGAVSEDRDEAISIASKHVSIRDGRAEIVRVDENKIFEYPF